jgi:deoxyribonuclease V
MRFQPRHPWDVTPQQALAIQQALRAEVVREDRLDPVEHVAGVDVGLAGERARVAVAVLSFPDLRP